MSELTGKAAIDGAFVDAAFGFSAGDDVYLMGVPSILPAVGSGIGSGIVANRRSGRVRVVGVIGTGVGKVQSGVRFAQDTEGRVHAIWAESETPPEVAGARVLSIFHSVLLSSGKWSAAEVVAPPARGVWTADAHSEVATDGDRLAIALAAESDGRPGVVVHSSIGGAWSRSFLPLSRRPAYVRLVRTAPGRLSLFHTGGTHLSPPFDNMMWKRESRDWSKTWTTPAQVSRQQQGPAEKPLVLAGDGEAIGDLAWAEPTQDGRRKRIVVVLNEGRSNRLVSWDSPDQIVALAGHSTPLVTVLVALVAPEQRSAELRLWGIQRTTGAVEVVRHQLLPATTAPRLLFGSTREVVLWWSTASDASPGSVPISRVRRIVVAC